jgi:ElaA protein
MASLLQWQCHDFEAYSIFSLYEMLRLRDQVFVLEQQSIYGDLDGLDQVAWHISGRNSHGELLAYARLLAPEHKYPDAIAIGRVVVEPAVRGMGIGQLLMAEALQHCERLFPGLRQKLSSQLSAQGFYQSLGFRQTSTPYDDGGILHVDMVRESAPKILSSSK